MSLFKDFGKSAKDLLSKEFRSDDHCVEINSSSAEKDVVFKSELFSKGKGKLDTQFELPNKVSLNVECETTDKVTAIMKVKDFMPKTTLTTKASTAHNFFFGLEHKHPSAAVTADLDYSPSSGSILSASALFVRKQFLAGGNCKFSDTSKLNCFSAGLGYSEAGKYELTGTYSENLQKAQAEVLLRFIHIINPSLTYGASFTRSMGPDDVPHVELGGQYALNKELTVGAKVNSAAQVGVFSRHQFNKELSLTQSLSLSPCQPGFATQFGLTFKLNFLP